MENIPTAEEFYKQNEDSFVYFKEILPPELYEFYSGVIQVYAIEFAKIHREAILKKANKEAEINAKKDNGITGYCNSSNKEFSKSALRGVIKVSINENSILNSYPENLIQ